MQNLSEEVFDDIEKQFNIILTERDKTLMHMYYGMLTIKIQYLNDEPEENTNAGNKND